MTRALGPALASALLLATGLAAQPIPRPRGNVSDFAGVLAPDAETRLDGEIRRLRGRGVYAAVATIERAHPRTPKQWATAAFEAWGVGQAGLDNGLLVLLSVGDRRVEIEVGYGLEARLTDAQVGAILDEYAVPAFREDAWGQGLHRTLQGLARHFQDPGGPPRFDLPATPPEGLYTLGLRVEPDDRARIEEGLAAARARGVAVTLAGVRSPAPPEALAQEVARRWVPLQGAPRVVVLLHGPDVRVLVSPRPDLAALSRRRHAWEARVVRPFLRGEDPERARRPGLPEVAGCEGAALAALAEALAEDLGAPLPGPSTATRRAALLEQTRLRARARLLAEAAARRRAARPFLPTREYRDTWPDLPPWALELGDLVHGSFGVLLVAFLLLHPLTVPCREVRLPEGARLVQAPSEEEMIPDMAGYLSLAALAGGWSTGRYEVLLLFPLWGVARLFQASRRSKRGRCPMCGDRDWRLRYVDGRVQVQCDELRSKVWRPEEEFVLDLGPCDGAAGPRPPLGVLAWALRRVLELALLVAWLMVLWAGGWPRWLALVAIPILVAPVYAWETDPYRAPYRKPRPVTATRASAYTYSPATTPSDTPSSTSNSWTSYSSSSSSSSDDDSWSSYDGGSSGGGGAGRSF